MRTLLDSDEFDIRYDIGVSQPTSSLQLIDCDQIVQSFATHFSIMRVKAELDQIVEGLKTLDLLDLIHSNPNRMRSLFVHTEQPPLTADVMLDLFEARLSPTGSNRRETEEAVLMLWVNYLQMIESMFNTVLYK